MQDPTMFSLLQHASRVRAAQTSDLWEVEALLDRVMTVDHADADELEDQVRSGQLIVLDVAGEIRGVACVRIAGKRGHLDFVVLDPVLAGERLEQRLRGVASALCVARGCVAMDIQ